MPSFLTRLGHKDTQSRQTPSKLYLFVTDMTIESVVSSKRTRKSGTTSAQKAARKNREETALVYDKGFHERIQSLLGGADRRRGWVTKTGSLLGIPHNSLRRITRGNIPTKTYQLDALCDHMGWDKAWLLTGRSKSDFEASVSIPICTIEVVNGEPIVSKTNGSFSLSAIDFQSRGILLPSLKAFRLTNDRFSELTLGDSFVISESMLSVVSSSARYLALYQGDIIVPRLSRSPDQAMHIQPPGNGSPIPVKPDEIRILGRVVWVGQLSV